MKNLPAVLIAFVLGASLSWAVLVSNHYFDRQTFAPASNRSPDAPPNFAPSKTPSAPPVVPNSPQPPASSFANQFREYQGAREKTLAANPDLATEYKALLSQIAAQEDALNAAMIQADPKVAPIIAKLTALRKQNQAQRTIQIAPTATPAPPHP